VTLTVGTLLGGRVRYEQPADGYRTGLEPVLLAAAVPARSGESVLEAGCGAGAGLLCLAARVAGISGLGLERDDAMTALAARNFAANRLPALRAETADVAAWRGPALFDHAFANPPWFAPADTVSPVAARRAAKSAHDGLLSAWVCSLARALRPRGTLSLILPVSVLPEAMAAFTAAKCGDLTLLPFWPREGIPARMLVLQGKRLGRGATRLMPGLALHDATGFTPQADLILRCGPASLPMNPPYPNPRWKDRSKAGGFAPRPHTGVQPES
jgi:tRNA1(Val) A37 N6-methylase TrmN6